MNLDSTPIKKHLEWGGKIRIEANAPAETDADLAIAYTPGVAEPCLAIKENPDLSYKLTRRHNIVAVITDGTAVLGLGDIGPEAGMPVMEGKCLLFKEFADIDAFPICVDTKDVDEFVTTVKNISKSFGGINLEDISAPRCFEIEKKLKEYCDIPVFHDDQHGTAVIVGASIINSLKLVNKNIADIKVVINGVGAAGTAIGKHLMNLGAKNVIFVDKTGAINPSTNFVSEAHKELAYISNPNKESGSLVEVIRNADVFIGVSKAGLVTKEMVNSMARDAIIFAMANPVPEIYPDEAKEAGALVIGTGRSDFPNQINNVLCFPGMFRGALDAFATDINEEMKIAATYALASLVSKNELSADYIIPSPLDKRVVKVVAEAVAEAARKTGVTRELINH